jgi:uncharacterized membrane protein YeaQ/YmgE (transglycosylase-associated protein family)
VSATGPAQEYLHALNRELRVGRRYRRRVLQELAGHIEDAAARERGLGLSADQAQRRAVERLGSIDTVAERISTTRRASRTGARERCVRFMAYLGACVVLACASLLPLVAGDSDGHLGLEVAAALTAAAAVLLVDLWTLTSRRVSAVLVGLGCVWAAAAVALIRDGDALFCAQVFAGVLGAAVLLSVARRLRLRPRGRGFQ